MSALGVASGRRAAFGVCTVDISLFHLYLAVVIIAFVLAVQYAVAIAFHAFQRARGAKIFALSFQGIIEIMGFYLVAGAKFELTSFRL